MNIKINHATSKNIDKLTAQPGCELFLLTSGNIPPNRQTVTITLDAVKWRGAQGTAIAVVQRLQTRIDSSDGQDVAYV